MSNKKRSKMEFTIKSRKYNKDITFFIGNGTSYIYVNLNGMSGTLGNQICDGGSLRGSTLSARTEQSFVAICRHWWNAYLRYERECSYK